MQVRHQRKNTKSLEIIDYIMNNYDVCRFLSKSGSFSGFTRELRSFLQKADEAEIVALYEFFRDESERFESEWRGEFDALLVPRKINLPEIDDSDEWASKLHACVDSGDLAATNVFLKHIGIESWDIDDDWEDGDLYPIEAQDENGELPIAKAERLGFKSIEQRLIGVLERFSRPHQPGT